MIKKFLFCSHFFGVAILMILKSKYTAGMEDFPQSKHTI